MQFLSPISWTSGLNSHFIFISSLLNPWEKLSGKDRFLFFLQRESPRTRTVSLFFGSHDCSQRKLCKALAINFYLATLRRKGGGNRGGDLIDGGLNLAQFSAVFLFIFFMWKKNRSSSWIRVDSLVYSFRVAVAPFLIHLVLPSSRQHSKSSVQAWTTTTFFGSWPGKFDHKRRRKKICCSRNDRKSSRVKRESIQVIFTLLLFFYCGF